LSAPAASPRSSRDRILSCRRDCQTRTGAAFRAGSPPLAPQKEAAWRCARLRGCHARGRRPAPQRACQAEAPEEEEHLQPRAAKPSPAGAALWAAHQARDHRGRAAGPTAALRDPRRCLRLLCSALQPPAPTRRRRPPRRRQWLGPPTRGRGRRGLRRRAPWGSPPARGVSRQEPRAPLPLQPLACCRRAARALRPYRPACASWLRWASPKTPRTQLCNRPAGTFHSRLSFCQPDNTRTHAFTFVRRPAHTAACGVA
jgi:hypothetical protein